MKLKTLLLAFVVAPIVGYAVSQVLWVIYDLALHPYISVGTFDTISSLSFGGIWGGSILYAILHKSKEKGKKKLKQKPQASKLENEIAIRDLTETVMPSRKAPLLEFIVLGNGKNLHQIVPYVKDAKYVSERTGKEYMVNEDCLLVVKPFWGRKKLVAVFDGEGEPVKIEKSTNPVTAETLYLADRTTALGSAIKQMFATAFANKKLVFGILIGVVAVAAIMILMGFI